MSGWLDSQLIFLVALRIAGAGVPLVSAERACVWDVACSGSFKGLV